MNNQKMLDVVTMIANVILPDKCDHESAVEIWLRAMKRKAREALEYREREVVGNAAAMREALLRCEAISNLREIREYQCVKDMRNIIVHALSAPPRQCDVGTAEEQDERFRDFCPKYTHGGSSSDCEGCKLSETPCYDCALAWAQTPYEAKEGAGK